MDDGIAPRLPAARRVPETEVGHLFLALLVRIWRLVRAAARATGNGVGCWWPEDGWEDGRGRSHVLPVTLSAPLLYIIAADVPANCMRSIFH